MNKGSRVAVVCCSNGQPETSQMQIEKLKNTLLKLELVPVFSDYIYEKDSVFSGTGRERAQALMNFYKDKSIQVIFDISGGDIANEVLPYLDFSVIADNPKQFWGYSDLTTIINAIYTKTGVSSVLYQVRNLIYEFAKMQIEDFSSTLFDGTDQLFQFAYEFVQGEEMQGIVVGGNIRCLLKLAGTEYFPDVQDKLLLLESRSGTVPQMTTYLNQLQQMGVLKKVKGILLGTFTQMEERSCSPAMPELVKQYVRPDMPIVKTNEIGRGMDSKAIVIGGQYYFSKRNMCKKPNDLSCLHLF